MTPAFCLAVLLSGPLRSAAALETFDGRVLPAAQALAQAGVKADADAGGVALVVADGSVHPLVKDETTRLLFLDAALHGRDFRLTARRVPGTPELRVTEVHALKGGVPHEVFYWCAQC